MGSVRIGDLVDAKAASRTQASPERRGCGVRVFAPAVIFRPRSRNSFQTTHPEGEHKSPRSTKYTYPLGRTESELDCLTRL